MNWDDLRIFLAVARQGTLAQAGARLGIDPTTVARRIQRLEQGLSAALFEHAATGQVLTPRGHALLEQAQAMEEAVIAATERSGSAGAAEGTIRVSVSEGFGSAVIAPNLHSFAARYPGIMIELIASAGLLNPSRREADIAIMLARPQSGPLVVRKLSDYHLGLYGQAGQSEPASLEAAMSARLIGYVPDLIYSPELRYLDDLPGKPSAALTSSSINAQAQMIRSGAGLGILPCFIGEQDAGLARLLRDQIDITGRLWLVLHRDMRTITRIRLFIDWLDQLVSDTRPILLG